MSRVLAAAVRGALELPNDPYQALRDAELYDDRRKPKSAAEARQRYRLAVEALECDAFMLSIYAQDS